MIIQCDKCRTRFRMADEKMRAQGVRVRCARCLHVFYVAPEDMPPTVAPEPVAPASLDFRESALERGAESELMPPAEQRRTSDEDIAAGWEDEGQDFDFASAPDGQDEDLAAEPFAFAAEETGPSAQLDDDQEDFGLGDLSFDEDEAAFEAGSSQGPLAEDDENAGEPDDLSFAEDASTDEDEPGLFVAAPEEDEPAAFSPEAYQHLQGLSEEDEQDFSAFTFAEDDAQDDAFDFSAEEPARVDTEIQEQETDQAQSVLEEDEDAFSADELTPADQDFSFSDTEDEDEEPFSFDMAQEGEAQPSEPNREEVKLAAGHFAASAAEEASAADAEEAKTGEDVAPEFVAVPVMPSKPLPRKNPIASLMVFLLIILILLTAVTGYLFWKKGPQSFENFLMGLLGGEPAATSTMEGIDLSGVQGAFVENLESGEFFIIRGEVINRFAESRSAIQIKGVIYDPAGRPSLQQTVFAGNPLTEDQLRNLPYARIEESMKNQFGDSLSNINVRPGQVIPFTIVFRNLPQGMSEFTVEIADSRPATAER